MDLEDRIHLFKSKHPLGMRVIVVNNYEPFSVGEVVGYDEDLLQKSNGTLGLVVKIRNTEVIPGGIIRRYREDLRKVLIKLTPEERWLVMAHNHMW